VNEDKANRYHRLRRRVSVSGAGLVAGWLVLLLISGLSVSLRDAAAAAASGSFVLTVIYYSLVVAMLTEAVKLPVAYYQGLILERRYGLSAQTVPEWGLDRARTGSVVVVLAAMGALMVCSLLRWSPVYWWLVASMCFVTVLVFLVRIGPVLLFPTFYRLKPVQRTELCLRIAYLAERTGAGELGVFECQFGHQARQANAMLAGIGRTRRVLLSDTLLADYSDDEVEVMLAHEIAHHVHHDIWKAIGLAAVLIVFGFYLTDLALDVGVGHFGLLDVGYIAGLPLLVLVGGAVSLVLMPLANALSRAHELRADKYALEITGNSEAFMSAIKRLAAQNLAEERPSRLVEILFYSHPPVAARLEAARAWSSGR